MSTQISKGVEHEKFLKMQRYSVFISKMEQMAKTENKMSSYYRGQVEKMQSSFMNSGTPMKDILRYYAKASVRGFDSSLMKRTLEVLTQTFKGRGQIARPIDDYSTKEFDKSWRMQQLTGHIKVALGEDMYFNHTFMGQSSRMLGEMGHKDTEMIQKQFNKLKQVLDDREQNQTVKKPLDFEDAVYGSFMNQKPRHYIFNGFESSEEFSQYVSTILEWRVEQEDGLANLGVQSSQDIEELEIHMAQLIQATNQVKDMQTDLQSTFDSLRQQYFKLMEAQDKHSFLKENKYVFFDLLQLQELLVEGGYLRPDEAEQLNSSQSQEVRMKRASQIFYEYCQAYAPELMSEQYDSFYQASQDSQAARTTPKQIIRQDEQHEKISLSSLSQSLIGLEQQALSFRKDAMDQDFLHKFYEQQTTQGEVKDEDHDLYKSSHLWESFNAQMKQDYLRGYYIFENEVRNIRPQMIELIKKSEDELEGQLHAMLALSSCKLDNKEQREEMYTNIQKLIGQDSQMPRIQSLVDGLHGIAMQGFQSDGSKQTAQMIAGYLDRNSELWQDLNLDQKLNLLWSLCALDLEGSQVAKEMYLDLNQMNFQRTDNDLSKQQFEKVYDIMVFFHEVSPLNSAPWVQDNTNEKLDILRKNPDIHRMRYDESSAESFDPFKKRVLEGVTRGLTSASIEHQMMQETDLFNQTEVDIFQSEGMYHLKPDVVFGFKGHKVLLNVLSAQNTMWDSGAADGGIKFRQKMLRAMNPGKNIQTIAVPISSVISYDIPNLKIKVKEEYSFIKDMKYQLNEGDSNFVINLDSLSQFGASFTKDTLNYMTALKLESDRKRVHSLFRQLYQIFQIKGRTERQYELPQQQQGLDNLKFELMKLSLHYESLPMHLKEYVNSFMPANFNTLQQLILSCKQNIAMRVFDQSVLSQDTGVNLSWQATRQEVELPVSQNLAKKKSILPELVNQRFMWVDDYFHYRDWEEKMKETYDSFNLLVVPRPENSNKFFHDRENHQRIVPQGIFPPSNKKREIWQSRIEDLPIYENSGDAINQFEKAPFKNMVQNELARSKWLGLVSDDISFMTNLQNMKQSLKRDFSDAQLMDLVLKDLKVTDSLIKEHLQGITNTRPQKEAKFIDRDPAMFREFMMSTYRSKDQEDPFSHFYIKESGKIERVHKVLSEHEELKQSLRHVKSLDASDKTKKIMKTLQNKMDDMLLQNKVENEDHISLSHHLDSEVKIDYNLKSLMKSEQVYDIDPELIDSGLKDQDYLKQSRKRAETKLIKASIIYKTHEGHSLSEQEHRYLRAWVSSIQKNKDLNILNHRDCLLTKNPSKMSITDLSEQDLKVLNRIHSVQFKKEMHGDLAVNDVILELSHFIDEEVINRVEVEMMSKRTRKEWNLPDDFNLLETRNKEISLVINELEELAWRMTGQLDSGEIDAMKTMLTIGRNKNFFDKQYFPLDMESLHEFIDTANSYDDRQKLIEEWLLRKEQEWKSRVMLPSKGLQKSDAKLYQQVDKNLKSAREKLIGQLNNDPNTEYKNLSRDDLARISEKICVRLHAFNGEYPEFMPQVVKGIMEHENLSRVDFDKLSTFTRIFELDWRGDRSVSNKREFLATNPIYLKEQDKSNVVGYGQIGNFEVTTMLRLACVPFVKDLTAKMELLASEKPTEQKIERPLEKKEQLK